jgi:voltage-gated potassium channel
MKLNLPAAGTIWNISLLTEIVFAAFILPALPADWQRNLFGPVYTLIYISAAFSLEKRPTYIIVLVFMTIVAEWISGFLHMETLSLIAKGVNILFFLVVVFLLLKHVATARKVTTKIILGSLIGYLLIGIIFAIFTGIIFQTDPAAFNITQTGGTAPDIQTDPGSSFYFVFVTLATLGYGDIVPLKAYSRSFSTLIAITGQFYIAVIVALLVGKFASRQNTV